ncbi:MAG: TolC family protein [Bacteroidales bacterium]|nr:TolC family protein [Bacteroidales bacterium]
MKKNKYIHISLLALALTLANIASAQTLTLDSCLSLALQNNVAVKNASLEVEAAKEVKKQVFTKYFPQVSLNANAYHALDPLIELTIDDIDNTNIRQVVSTLYDLFGQNLGFDDKITFLHYGVVAGATAVQPVYMGGQIVNGNKLAAVGVEAAEYKGKVTSDEVLLQTEESYWLVISLREKKKTILEVQGLLDTLYKDVKGACDAGLVTRNDLLKVTLKQNELAQNLLKVNNGIKLASMALCQSIGIPYTDELMLADTLSTSADELMTIYRDADVAVANRNESHLLDLNDEAERLKRKMTIGETLPHILVGGMYGYANILEKNTFNGALFATVSVPISGWGETAHKLKEQRLRQEIAANNHRDLNEKMQLQTQQAWNELQEAYHQTLLAEQAVNTARDNMNVCYHNYQAGLISLSELLEAQVLYRQAVDQRNDYRIAYRVSLTKYRQLTR